jgi:hypothetical protein
MKSTDNNKNKENTCLTDDELDKVAGGIAIYGPRFTVCNCNNRVVKEMHEYNMVSYICGNCGGYIPSNQVK